MSVSSQASIHYSRVGEAGQTVVFLHGLFGQGKNFTGVARALEPELSSVLVDVPNHGDSEWTDDFDYLDVADSLAELVAGFTEAEGGPVHLVGHSMGGKLAMILALRHPELIDRLVIVDISPTSRQDTSEFEHLLGSLAGLDVDSLGSRSEAQKQLQDAIPSTTIRGFLLQSLVRDEANGFRWKPNLHMLLNSLSDIGGFPDMGERTFSHPVLWIGGGRSNYITDENVEPMRSLFPLVRQFTIKDAGHWVHAEEPEIFSSAVKHFLTSAAS